MKKILTCLFAALGLTTACGQGNYETDVFKTKSGKYVCSVCGYVYDPKEHDGLAFENLPEEWTCPRCRQPKTKFNAA